MQRRGNHKGKHHRKEPKEYDEQVIQIDRVTKVVKGGRTLRFRATVCIGNRKGKVGVGLGKSNEVTGAIQKAIAKAKKELNWKPKTSFDQLVKMMVEHDLDLAEREKVLIENKLILPTWENSIN